ncbi:TetR family transcriptional regulator [Yoonia maricola]|uniref:TetR family transcriptional regulator n=1 Tax=Yoonia maricola TaxID=420999 RepID=A0A2M8WNL3_9RHOB|nr:TetR/AcrR family transcriptional regulator [Yoonia maricola]PJI92466.1 TetR family transcriptional regulator [Yoonia maricola]
MARKQGSHSDITGPKVRDAALRLIAQHGYAAVSMRQIAAEVGIQAGALYNYTPDKQTLLYDLMRGHMTDLLTAWSLADQKGGPMVRLEAFTRFHIRFHLPRPDQVFVSYMELRNLSEQNFAAVEAQRREYEDALEGILRAGEAAGVFAVPDPRITTMALIAMLTGISNWYRAGGRLETDKIEAIYWDMVRRSVTA